MSVFPQVLPLLAAAWLIASLLMLTLWIWHLRLRNAAVVDVGWAAGLALVAVMDAVFGVGDPVRRWVAYAIVATMAPGAGGLPGPVRRSCSIFCFA